MKKLLTIFAIICSFQMLFAQITSITSEQRTIDSLKQALLATSNDTLRLVLANELRYNYFLVNTNYDSTLIYSTQVYDLAHILGYKIDEAYALDMIGDILDFQHNENTLETLFRGVKIAENPQSENKILPRKYLELMTYWTPDLTSLLKKNNWSPHYFRLSILGSLYQDLGHTYGKTIPNRERLFFYMSKAIELYRSQKDTSQWGLTYENIAEYFYSTNQLDSALYYAQKADALRGIYNKWDLKYATNPLLAAIYFKKGNDSLSLYLVTQAIQKGYKYVKWWSWLSYSILAEYFFKNSMIDTSLYYAIKAHKLVIDINSQDNLQKTSALLAKLYKKKNVSDSALKYYEMALALNDSINDENKKAQLQRQDFEQQREQEEQEQEKARDKLYTLFAGFATLLTVALFLLWNNRQRKNANKVLQQKNIEIEHAIQDLKSTQAQLIQSEQMASLGELTSGIAHEIQNPLNFVNNFSEVNKEIIIDMKEEINKGNYDEVKLIAENLEENEEKILHHGKRADSIVKAMLQHSRASTGKKEAADISALADEYLRLSYHDLRAKDKSFNATIKTDFDESIEKINVVPQDIGRVLLNLFNNAFYAVSEKKKITGLDYEPVVSICTKKVDTKVEIRVKDNGTGIPQKVGDKIFQPFFTTKPTEQGTGLGLSLSYDIVKAHGGEIKVESKEGEGSEFIISLQLT